MGVFIVLYIYLIAIGIFSYSFEASISRRKLQTYLSGFGLWFVLAFRSPLCGVDLLGDMSSRTTYYTVFQDVQNYTLMECFDVTWMLRTGMDVGWILYNKLLSWFTADFQFVLAVTALIEIYLISKVIYKFSSHIVLSFIVFFTMGIYLASFSTLRQIFALSISSYSFIYLFDKRYYKFIFFVALASLFHFSALVFFVIYPLSKISFNRRVGLWALTVIVLSIPFLSLIIQFITQGLLGGLRSGDTDEGGAYTLFLVYVFIYVMTLFLKTDSIYNNYLKIFMLLAVAGQSLGAISTGHLTRIAFYFSIFFILSIPQLLDRYIEKRLLKVSIFALSLLLFIFFWYVSKDGYLNVVPYSFCWEAKVV